MKWEGVHIVNRLEAAALQAAAGSALTKPLTRVEVLEGPKAVQVFADGQDFERGVRQEPDMVMVSGEVRADRKREAMRALDNDQVVVNVAVRGLTLEGVRRRRNKLVYGATARLGR